MQSSPDDILDTLTSGTKGYCAEPTSVPIQSPKDAFLFGLPELTLINRTIATCVIMNQHVYVGPEAISLIKTAFDAQTAVVQSLDRILENIDLIQMRPSSETPPDPSELSAAIEQTGAAVLELVKAGGQLFSKTVGSGPWNQSGPVDMMRFDYLCFYQGLLYVWKDFALKIETPQQQR